MKFVYRVTEVYSCSFNIVTAIQPIIDSETRVYSCSSNIVTAVQLIIDTVTRVYSCISNTVTAVNVLQKCYVFHLLKYNDQCTISH